MSPTEIYAKIAVTMADDTKVRALARFGAPDAGLARDLYVQMVLHCKRLLTDGFVPDEQVGLLVYPLDPDHGKELAKQLAAVGLINEEAGGWQVLAYVKRNGTREDVERLSEVRAAAGAKGGRKSRHRRKGAGQHANEASSKQNASQNGSRSNPYTETETETYTKENPPSALRADVSRLCSHLADRIEANGSRRPTITRAWHDAARLMLDRDGRAEEQIRRAIDWCQDSEFWRSNVMSMPKLRDKYDQLRLQAQQDTGRPSAPQQVTHTDEEYQRGWN